MNAVTPKTERPQPTTGPYLTPSHVLEYLYCPRFTYFEYVLAVPEHQERRLKVQKGRSLHEYYQRLNPSYLRKKLGVVKKEIDVEMCSMPHRLKGIVDEVLWLDDGTLAPLDYKFAEDKGRVFKNLRMQSVLYGLLIRETYGKPVWKGFLCYTRSNNRIKELAFTDKDFAEAEQVVDEVLDIIQTGFFPKGTTWKARCGDCCYRNICVR